MLKIRPEQIRVFHEALLEPFVDRLVGHLGKFFPDQCETLGVPALRDVVRDGIGRAESHGFASERDLCKYLNLAFTFGRDFDTDPALPWAAEILALKDVPSQKMDRLYKKALEHADEGRGFMHRHEGSAP